MKILLLGASGTLGRTVLNEGVRAGHEITVLIRTPEKLGVVPQGVKVVVGDVLTTQLEPLVAGVDAVVQSLGVGGKGDGKATSICADGNRRLLTAIGDRSTRMVAVSNIGVDGSGTAFFRKFVLPVFVRWLQPIIADKENMERDLRASRTRWTAVRFPAFSEKPAEGGPRFSRTGVELGFTINLESAAQVLLWLAGSDAYKGEAVCVSD